MSFKKETVTFLYNKTEWIAANMAWAYCTLKEPIYCIEDNKYYLVVNYQPTSPILYLVETIITHQDKVGKDLRFTIMEKSKGSMKECKLSDLFLHYAILLETKTANWVFYEKSQIIAHTPLMVLYNES